MSIHEFDISRRYENTQNLPPYRDDIEDPETQQEEVPIYFNVITVNASGEEVKRQHKSARQFSEDLGNGIVLELVEIPGGTFLMGQTDAEKAHLITLVGEKDYKEYYARELPQHTVTVASFWMGKYLVTQEQWRAAAALSQVERKLRSEPSGFKGDKRPVENVSWHDTVEFCKRLSQKTERTYRLPSEAEWEYACRAGTTTPFHFGETITSELANYYGTYTYASESKGTYRKQTTEVGSFPPNAFGLYDMHGNVWEWCADPWHENYQGAPNDGRAWEAGGDTKYRVLRGGSWFGLPRVCRCARRFGGYPDYSGPLDGFRVVVALIGRTLHCESRRVGIRREGV